MEDERTKQASDASAEQSAAGNAGQQSNPGTSNVDADSGAGVRQLVAPARFSKFLSVGAVGAVVDNTVLVLLVELVAVEPVFAAVGAKETSILLMFALNERWTFGEHGGGGLRDRGWRLLKSNVVRSGGAIVGIATLYVLYRWAGLWYLAANVFGIGVGFFFNYTFESLVTWRVHEP
ncbi:GtrA family protein [Halobacteriales archaeon QS_1_68_20]|nr:MAG: GtrA family protein [Halobacteriales archaeon QS_1_68_20]